MEYEERIKDTMEKMEKHLSSHNSICVGVSGGSDSNIIVHMIATYFREFLPKIHFVFCNTGLEFDATKKHLGFMQDYYNIKIEEIKGMPIPIAIKKYGAPFLSKQVAEYIGRLQLHDFKFVDDSFENLYEQYPTSKGALRWWCNDYSKDRKCKSRFDIDWNKGLKEFMCEFPPNFSASSKCCDYSKKKPMQQYIKQNDIDLSIVGERKAEGGKRAAGTSCFKTWHGIDKYMPLFFWNDEVKDRYKDDEGILYSDCYEKYGMNRTGCAGCPFSGGGYKHELEIIKKYEPALYKACMYLFGQAYDYQEHYLTYRKHKKKNDN